MWTQVVVVVGVGGGVGGVEVEVEVVGLERRATPRQVKKSILCSCTSMGRESGKCKIRSFVVV